MSWSIFNIVYTILNCKFVFDILLNIFNIIFTSSKLETSKPLEML